MTMEEILTSGLAELGVPTTAAQLSQLRAYYTLLDERSKVMNLTAIEGEEATARLHFLDSAALLRYVRLSGKTAADIGSFRDLSRRSSRRTRTSRSSTVSRSA